MIAPAAPPTAAPMMAPRAVDPVWLPMTPPTAAPVAAPITAPFSLLLLLAAQPTRPTASASVMLRDMAVLLLYVWVDVPRALVQVAGRTRVREWGSAGVRECGSAGVREWVRGCSGRVRSAFSRMPTTPTPAAA